MKIAFVSPEAVPYAKTGGLADVSGALPKALGRLGIEVALVLPCYKTVDRAKFGIAPTGKKVSAFMDGRKVSAEVLEADHGKNVKAYFIDKPSYYGRDQLYGTPKGDYPDNAERFMFFSKAVPEVLKSVGFSPDVVHVNDWQSALVPLYIKALYREDPFFARAATLCTVHNLGYQGVFWAYDMHLTGLGWEYFTLEGFEFYGKINLLKAALVFSDAVNTVSKTYSREIQTPEYGHGLDGVLRVRARDLYGIVNGIDYDEWDPATDKNIYTPYGPGDIKGKLENKRALKRELGLAAGKKPLFGIITRLADQKGLDILAGAMEGMLKKDLQFVLLGTGDEKYHRLFSALAKKRPRQVSVNLGFDAKLAAKIYAGSDVFMMPSRYEPCGLGQLISFRYGTVPLVRKTGGLADTVRNYNPKTGLGNGFVFSGYSKAALMRAVNAALGAYSDKRAWNSLVKRGMAEDNSWEHSAGEYIKLYRKTAETLRKKGERAA